MFKSAKIFLAEQSSQDCLLRLAVIAGIVFGLLIPLSLVKNMVEERDELQQEAVASVAQSWGECQTLKGPALIIPYLPSGYNPDYNSYRYMALLPKTLQYESEVKPQERYYGMYRTVVYTAPTKITGTYTLPDLSAFGQTGAGHVAWDKAWLAVGLSGLKGLSTEPLEWNGAPAGAAEPGTQAAKALGDGLHMSVQVDPDRKEQTFSLALSFNGSGRLAFTPVGENTRIKVSGPWPAPSFTGDALPNERTITDDSFTASWNLSYLSRSYPQKFDLENSAIHAQLMGFTAKVELFDPISLYSKIERALKYGILFIGATFAAFFTFELATRARLHLVQYGMVGTAMVVFYLTLLSLAERVPFAAAYLAASGVTTAIVGLYIGAALRNRMRGALMAGILVGLYASLYAILQMEDFALPVGTGLILVIMSGLMYVTRHLPVGGAENGTDGDNSSGGHDAGNGSGKAGGNDPAHTTMENTQAQTGTAEGNAAIVAKVPSPAQPAATSSYAVTVLNTARSVDPYRIWNR